MIEVVHTEKSDLEEIFEFFDQSVLYQEKNGYPVWRNYDKDAIRKDMEDKNHYKVVSESRIAIVFSVRYSDKIIWRELDKGDSLYLHRIVVNPHFKGRNLFGVILDWAISHAKQKQLGSIRMDTWTDNPTLISYYKRFGFTVVDNYITPDSDELPTHNRNLALTLLAYTR